MDDLIKLDKAQLASDRMSCHNATANQVRLGGNQRSICMARREKLSLFKL
jgi:hypothetical protein